jgi:hypothetical protein
MRNQNQLTNNKSTKQSLLALALALLLALTGLVAGTVVAQPQATLKLVPSTSRIDQGEAVDVALRIEGVRNLYAAQAKVHFDPARLAVQDADPATKGVQIALRSLLSPDLVIVNEADNETGTLRLSLSQVSPSPPAEGSGDLAAITFEGVGSGATALTWSDVILADIDGQEIKAHLEGAEIQVERGLVGSALFAAGAGIVGLVLISLAGWRWATRRQSA